MNDIPKAAESDKQPKKLELFKNSFAVLHQDKQLALFPLKAALYSMLVALFYGALAVMALAALGDTGMAFTIVGLVLLFLFYLTEYYTLVYFNTGLAASVLGKFSGGQSGHAFGISQAKQKRKQIVGYALLAAVVGWVLAIIAERFKVVGGVLQSLIGATWSLATVFIAPVIITTDLSPVAAVKQSARVFTKVWGRTILGNVGFMLLGILGVLVSLLPLAGAILIKEPMVIIASAIVGVIGIVIVSIVVSACSSIYRTALFYYATKNKVPDGFPSNLPLSVKSRPESKI